MNNDNNSGEALFADFPKPTAADWASQAEKDLRGASLDSLTWHTYESIAIKPFYTREDLEKLNLPESKPGSFPFTRGHKFKNNNWQNTQVIKVHGNGLEAIQKAADALQSGADAIHFYIYEPNQFYFQELVTKINLDKTTVSYTLPQATDSFLESLYEALEKNQQSHYGLKGFIEFEPTVTGKVDLKLLEKTLDRTKNDADFYGITINGAHFANRGATTVQEIAFVLSLAVNKTDELTKAGIPLETVLRNMQFHMAAGTNYFFEIAKFRTIRLLWGAIVKAYQADENLAALLRIYVSTSRWYQTTFDPYVNLLRATTEAMSAVIGGCDAVSVAPFDSSYKEANEFSERISRNIPLILKEEAYLDKAADPAAGSYYLESLTNELAEKAWELFTRIEKAGGYTEAAKSGFITDEIHKISEQKFTDIASGKKVLVGTNKYPNPNEKTDFEPTELMRSQLFDTTRASYPYEIIRMATLNHFLKSNQRPQAAIVVLDGTKQDEVNTNFAKEFLHCAGFETSLQVYENLDEATSILSKLQPSLLVLSTSSSDFIKFTEKVNPLMEQFQEKPTLLLGSDPLNMKEDLIELGFDEFLFKGCDTAAIIHKIRQKLDETE